MRNKIINDKKYLKRDIKSKDRNKFVDIFMNKSIFYSYIISIFTLAFALAFAFLDYFVYTEIFHLHKASFIENYIYNIDISSSIFLLIGFIVLPISIILFAFFYIYLHKVISKKIIIATKKYKKINTFKIIILFIVLSSILDLLIYYLLYINLGIFFLISSIFLVLLFSLFSLFLFLPLVNKIEKIISFKFLIFLGLLFYLYVYFFTEILFFYEIVYKIIILNIGSLILLYCYTLSDKKSIYNIELKPYVVFSTSFISIYIILYCINYFCWNIDNYEKSVPNSNLIFNTSYVSPNHHNIKVNVLGYANNDFNILKCQSFRDNKTYLDIKADTNTTYMPFFKHQKIYFVKKDKILTCVYVVKEKDDKYLLSEIGYLGEN